jgi:hypothetical protein
MRPQTSSDETQSGKKLRNWKERRSGIDSRSGEKAGLVGGPLAQIGDRSDVKIVGS